MSRFSTFCFCMKLLFAVTGIAFFTLQIMLMIAFQLMVVACRLFAWGWRMSYGIRGTADIFSSIVSSITNRMSSIPQAPRTLLHPRLTTEQQQLQEAIHRSLLESSQTIENQPPGVRQRRVLQVSEFNSHHTTEQMPPSISTSRQECPYPTENTNCLQMPQPLIPHPEIYYIQHMSSPYPSAPYVGDIEEEREYQQAQISELYNVD